jgi:FKBP-type peptidyl-prolyl cis-trans isomerase SlyD
MQIAANTVVKFHLTLTDEAGIERDSSRARNAPVAYLHGHQNLLPKVEEALEGLSAGARTMVTVPPEHAYGRRDPFRTERVKRRDVDPQQRAKVGDVLRLRSNRGLEVVTVQKVGMHTIDLDLNHPLAGHTLNFDLEVIEVRAATSEEVAHGHAHGDGGHAH